MYQPAAPATASNSRHCMLQQARHAAGLLLGWFQQCRAQLKAVCQGSAERRGSDGSCSLREVHAQGGKEILKSTCPPGGRHSSCGPLPPPLARGCAAQTPAHPQVPPAEFGSSIVT